MQIAFGRVRRKTSPASRGALESAPPWIREVLPTFPAHIETPIFHRE